MEVTAPSAILLQTKSCFLLFSVLKVLSEWEIIRTQVIWTYKIIKVFLKRFCGWEKPHSSKGQLLELSCPEEIVVVCDDWTKVNMDPCHLGKVYCIKFKRKYCLCAQIYMKVFFISLTVWSSQLFSLYSSKSMLSAEVDDSLQDLQILNIIYKPNSIIAEFKTIACFLAWFQNISRISFPSYKFSELAAGFKLSRNCKIFCMDNYLD